MVGDPDPLAMGRAALAQAAWPQARLHFEEATAAGAAGDAWEGLSWAAWWQGDQETILIARERAYRAYRETADTRGAARMAMRVAGDHLDFRGDEVVAMVWLRRARTLVRAHGPCAELGFITVLEADIALAMSDPLTASTLAGETVELAQSISDAGVEVVALAVLGSALVPHPPGHPVAVHDLAVTDVTGLGTVLGIWAHPDDEAFLAGGLMAAARDAGQRVVCVTATLGEHGTDDPHAWPPDRLARVRRHELAASLAVLGVDEHHLLGITDGTCAAQPHDALVRHLGRVIDTVVPDTIVTFGPDGLTGHEDHQTVSY